jgi:hypothetical protein
VEIPIRVGVETREHGLLVAACLSCFSQDDLRVAALAEHSLEKNVGEDPLPADGTPEKLEQSRAVSVEYVETYWLIDPAVPGHPFLPG